MKICCVHFGMYKTGSTSIQATLAALGSRPDFCFLKSGEANAGRALATIFMDEPERYGPNRWRGLGQQTLERRKRKYLADFESQLQGPQPLFVISSEMLPRFSVSALTALRDWLLGHVDVIRLFGYVREPASLMESAFQQSLKNGSGEFDLAKRYPDYRERFEPLEQVFGRDRVEYRLFAPASFPGQCVVRDFVETIGLDLPESAILRVNEGLSLQAAGLLYTYRQFQQHKGKGIGKEALRRNRQLVLALRGLAGDKMRIAPALLRELIDGHPDDMAWISQRLGQPLRPVYAPEGARVISSERELLVFSDATLHWVSELTGHSLQQSADVPIDPRNLAEALTAYLETQTDVNDDSEGQRADGDPVSAGGVPPPPVADLVTHAGLAPASSGAPPFVREPGAVGKSCIVHFGMPKTGSTSIQSALLSATPMPGASLLHVGQGGNSSRLLATLFMDDPTEYHLNKKWDVPAEELARQRLLAFGLLDAQIGAEAGPFILSAEAISTMDEPSLIRMCAWLDSRFSEVRLVGYVRAPRGYMESELQQKIKAGRGRFKPERNYPGYEARFGKLERVFGPERVSFWKFDPKAFPDNDVVRDFVQRLGLDLAQTETKRTNESLSLDGVALLYIYRKLGPGYGTGPGSVEQNRHLVRQLRELEGPRLRLSPSLVQPILDDKAGDIAWMEQRLGTSLAESPGPEPESAVQTEDDLLHPSLAALEWLAERLGGDKPAQVRVDLPTQTIADWMHELRLRNAPRHAKTGAPRDASRLIADSSHNSAAEHPKAERQQLTKSQQEIGP